MKDGRIYLYDNMRAVLIFLVVLGHAADYLTGISGFCRDLYVFIYAFHMPAFLFLSGLFNSPNHTASKVLGYINVGFMLKIMFTLTTLLMDGAGYFSLLSDSGLPWYMFVLAAYIGISRLLQGANKRALLVFSLLLSCFVGYDNTTSDWLYLSRAIVFYPFFLLGQMLDRERLAALSRHRYLRLGGVAVLLFWAALCFCSHEKAYVLRPLFTARNPYATDAHFLPWGFFWRFICYGISFTTGFALLCVIPAGRLPFVTTCGQRTMQIYFWHFFFFYLLSNGLGLLAFSSTRGGKLLWLSCAVAVTALTSAKLFSFPTEHILRFSRLDEHDSHKTQNASPV